MYTTVCTQVDVSSSGVGALFASGELRELVMQFASMEVTVHSSVVMSDADMAMQSLRSLNHIVEPEAVGTKSTLSTYRTDHQQARRKLL